jgi:VIT1/CCC1 family predicted Fe2+/Mn2+ transporter
MTDYYQPQVSLLVLPQLHPDRNTIVLAALAGMIAGAMSMAAGEYVSVSSQEDTEKADLLREKRELEEMPEVELLELAKIYEKRGVSKETALKVATELTEHDALAAHAHDEWELMKLLRQNLYRLLASFGSFLLERYCRFLFHFWLL